MRYQIKAVMYIKEYIGLILFPCYNHFSYTMQLILIVI